MKLQHLIHCTKERVLEKMAGFIMHLEQPLTGYDCRPILVSNHLFNLAIVSISLARGSIPISLSMYIYIGRKCMCVCGRMSRCWKILSPPSFLKVSAQQYFWRRIGWPSTELLWHFFYLVHLTNFRPLNEYSLECYLLPHFWSYPPKNIFEDALGDPLRKYCGTTIQSFLALPYIHVSRLVTLSLDNLVWLRRW